MEMTKSSEEGDHVLDIQNNNVKAAVSVTRYQPIAPKPTVVPKSPDDSSPSPVKLLIVDVKFNSLESSGLTNQELVENALTKCPECQQTVPVQPGMARDASLTRHLGVDCQRRWGVVRPDGTCRLPCNHCSASFETLGMLRHHMEKYHKNCQPVIDIPPFGTQRPATDFINEHTRVLSECAACKKCFPTINAFLKHAARGHTTHESKEKFRCTECQLRFPSREVLIAHNRDVHKTCLYFAVPNDLGAGKKAVLDSGPDTSMKGIPASIDDPLTDDSNIPIQWVSCAHCGHAFRGERTLHLHMLKYHPNIPLPDLSSAPDTCEEFILGT